MGLTEEEVLKSRQKYGSNEIKSTKKSSFLKQYLITLGDPIIRILLIALAIKTVFLIKQFDFSETSASNYITLFVIIIIQTHALVKKNFFQI